MLWHVLFWVMLCWLVLVLIRHDHMVAVDRDSAGDEQDDEDKMRGLHDEEGLVLLDDGVHCKTTGHGLMQLLARVLVYMQILRGVAVGEAVFVCGEAKIFASLLLMWS